MKKNNWDKEPQFNVLHPGALCGPIKGGTMPINKKEFLSEEKATATLLNFYKKLDNEFSFWFLKPKWCPFWLYKIVGKIFVNIERKK